MFVLFATIFFTADNAISEPEDNIGGERETGRLLVSLTHMYICTIFVCSVSGIFILFFFFATLCLAIVFAEYVQFC